jgi:DNA-binding transcriptional MerR regulator
MQTPWTIEELVRRANEVFQQQELVAPNGRVREIVSLRLVRLYTTLGLLDRPVLRGRTGYYGMRHLMQLVAIKRLQSEGCSLAEIQNRLLALSEEELAQVAHLPETFSSASEGILSSSRRLPTRAFWRVAEAPAPEAVMESQPSQQPLPVERWSSIAIAPGVHLLIQQEILADPQLLQELQQAAAPLVRFLRSRHLVRREARSIPDKGG